MRHRQRITRILGRWANTALRPCGVELRHIPTPPANAFYRPPRSCQIPELPSLYELVFGRRATGYFVEVGAFDGETFSNTSCLADLGWSGVLIEPVPEFASKCRTRHRDNDVVVLERAAGSTEGSMPFTVAGGLSSANESVIDEHRTRAWSAGLVARGRETTVSVSRLDTILAELGAPPGFDLLVVDVEGGEREVFDGFDLALWQPRMLIVELSDTHPGLASTRESDVSLSIEIADVGYRVIYKDHINTIFLRRTNGIDRDRDSESPDSTSR